MSVGSAFNSYQDTIDEDPAVVAVARERREMFKRALTGESDVLEVWSSGSLRRSTQLKPIHDLDLVVVFDQDVHPTWGLPGESAAQSLRDLGGRINALLGATDGIVAQLVRLADPRNHAVKCFIDAPDSGFTVDAMPALRQGDGTLLIPEKLSSDWVPANPEYLIKAVQDRHDAWSHYRPVVRVLKDWRLDAASRIGSKVKSLVVEVLALHCLPTRGSRASAIAAFFTSAAYTLDRPVCDPAELCGEIQPDLDYVGFRAEVERAGELATQAVICEELGDDANAQRLWREIFGADFPAPPGAPTITPAGTPLLSPQPVKDSPQG